MNANEIANILQINFFESLFTRNELADIWRIKWADEPKFDQLIHELRSKQQLQWNAHNKLECRRLPVGNVVKDERYTIAEQESIWFSSDGFIVLGEIDFFPNKRLVLDLTIIEHAKDWKTEQKPNNCMQISLSATKPFSPHLYPYAPKKYTKFACIQPRWWEFTNIRLFGKRATLI